MNRECCTNIYMTQIINGFLENIKNTFENVSPTGTLRGAIVSITLIPLIKPYVAFIVMALTLLFLNNCYTSHVTLIS